MKIRNLVIGAVGLLSLGAVACGAQGGTENVGSSEAKILSGSWATMSPTTALTARWGMSSCALNSTEILVAGGYTNTAGSSYSNAVQVLNINAGTPTWTSKANLNIARAEAKMIPLGNNRCLLVGGKSASGVENTVELYDGTNNQWYQQTATLGTARHAFTLSKFGTSKLLVAGGLDGSSSTLSSTEILDISGVSTPAVGSVTRAAGPTMAVSSATARAFAAAVNFSDNVTYIAGGLDGGGNVIKSVVRIDASAGTPAFTRDTDMNLVRSNFTLTKLAASGSNTVRIAAIAGYDASFAPRNSAEIFASTNATTNGAWTNDSSTLTTARGDHLTIETGTVGTVLVIGGQDISGPTSVASSQEWVDGSGFTNQQTFTDGAVHFAAEYLSGSSGSAKIVMAGGLKAQTPSVLSATRKY